MAQESIEWQVLKLILSNRETIEDEVAALLEQGVQNINVKDSNSGRGLLHYAAFLNRENTIRLLLTCENIDVNMPDNSNQTPLHYAAIHGFDGITNLLLAHCNTDIHFQTHNGNTAYDLATRQGHKKSAKSIEEESKRRDTIINFYQVSKEWKQTFCSIFIPEDVISLWLIYSHSKPQTIISLYNNGRYTQATVTTPTSALTLTDTASTEEETSTKTISGSRTATQSSFWKKRHRESDGAEHLADKCNKKQRTTQSNMTYSSS